MVEQQGLGQSNNTTSNLAQASHLKWRRTDAVSGGFKLQCIAIATFSIVFNISLT